RRGQRMGAQPRVKCSDRIEATQPVNLFAVGRCRNSFGPCAFDSGPSTPVITNWAFGNLRPSMPMNGIVPPSPIEAADLPKKDFEARSTAESSQGSSFGALQPVVPAAFSRRTLAP